MNNKIILSLVLGLFLIGFVIAASVGTDDSDFTEGRVVYTPAEPPVNYSLVNVNNSQFLRGLTPQEVADLFDASGYVPYTGATANVDLGIYNLTASYFFGNGSQLTDLPVTSPAGADTQVQYNDNGVFGADAGLTYNDATDLLTIVHSLTLASGSEPSHGLTVLGMADVNGIDGDANQDEQGSLIDMRGGVGSSDSTGIGAYGGRVQFVTGAGGACTKSTGASGGPGGQFLFSSGAGGASTATSGIASGGAGGIMQITSGSGGDASSASTGRAAAGAGGIYNLMGGTGGTASGSGTSGTGNTGGLGGSFSLTGGTGGMAASSQINKAGGGGVLRLYGGLGGGSDSGTVGVGGKGGTIALYGGHGAASYYASISNTGGNGGDIILDAGGGGTGHGNGVVDGVDGHIIFKNDGTEIARFDNTAGAVGYFRLTSDNQKFMLGTGQDASIYYNSTDMIINPKEVGSGKLYVLGDLVADSFIGDGSGLTGIGGVSRWLNTSDYLYIDSNYPQHINISGNATFGGGALFKGAILGDESLGYENIRFGVFAHTPRIIFDNGSMISQMDYVGDTLRFILNDSGTMRATMRVNNSAVRIGEAGHRRNLYLYGDLIGVDPAGGGANIIMDGNITAENVFLPAYIRIAGNNTQNVETSMVWVNVTLDKQAETLKKNIEHTWNDDTNDTITINDAGVYKITYTTSFVDSAPNPDAHIGMRLYLLDGAVVKGSYSEVDTHRQDEEVFNTHSFLTEFDAGDEFKIQFTSDDTTVSSYLHATFEPGGSIIRTSIHKIAN